MSAMKFSFLTFPHQTAVISCASSRSPCFCISFLVYKPFNYKLILNLSWHLGYPMGTICFTIFGPDNQVNLALSIWPHMGKHIADMGSPDVHIAQLLLSQGSHGLVYIGSICVMWYGPEGDRLGYMEPRLSPYAQMDPYWTYILCNLGQR